MKRNRNLARIVMLFVIAILLFNIPVNAVSVLPEEVFCCFADYTFEEIEYNGKLMKIPYTLARINGEDYPVYSRNQEKTGVTTDRTYCVKIISKLNNESIKRIFKIGYPNRSFEDMNCENEIQAYAMTQMAIFDEYYHFDLEKIKLKENSNLDKNFIENLKDFITLSRKKVRQEEIAEIVIDEETPYWQEEGKDLCSKTFRIICEENIEKYRIELRNSNGNIKIVDENNEDKKEFNKNEKFKVIIPKKEDSSFEIVAKTYIKNDIILVGNNESNIFLNYLFSSDTEEIEGNLNQEYIMPKVEESTNEEENEETKENNQTVINKYVNTEKKQIDILPQTGM